MQDDLKNSLINALSRSTSSFMKLIDKLEADGYIKNLSMYEGKVSVYITNELFSFVFANIYSVYGNDSDLMLPVIPVISGEYFERNTFIARSKEFSDSIENGNDILNITNISGFDILLEFDKMASMFDGAFYSRMKIDNPGYISDLYIELFQGIIVLTSIIYAKDSKIIDFDKAITNLKNKQTEVL